MSGARSRRKGRAWENAVAGWLRSHGFPLAQRREYLDANLGDIEGVPGWSLEAKAAGTLSLGAWVEQAQRQAENAGVDRYAVVVKRHGRASPKDAFIVMSMSEWARWAKETG